MCAYVGVSIDLVLGNIVIGGIDGIAGIGGIDIGTSRRPEHTNNAVPHRHTARVSITAAIGEDVSLHP
jgi:hypothetical protein